MLCKWAFSPEYENMQSQTANLLPQPLLNSYRFLASPVACVWRCRQCLESWFIYATHLQSLTSRFSHLPPQLSCSWRQWENERKCKGSLDKHNFPSRVVMKVQLKFNYGGFQANIFHKICSYGNSLPLSKSQERSREFGDFFSALLSYHWHI